MLDKNEEKIGNGYIDYKSLKKYELNAMYELRAWFKQSVKRYFLDSWENRPWAGHYYMILVNFAGSAIVDFFLSLYLLGIYHEALKHYDISNQFLNILAKQN